MSDLPTALLAGMRAAPHLDPSMVYGIASSGIGVDDVPDAAAGTAGFANALKRKSQYQQNESSVQATMWAGATQAERDMLQAVGYAPPQAKKAHHHGFLNSITSGITATTEGISHGVGDVLHWAGAPLRNLQHALRTAHQIDEMGFSAGFSTHNWAQMWDATENGERTFDLGTMRKLEQRYDPDTLNLAKDIAAAKKQADIDALISRVPEDQRGALAKRIDTDPELKDLVRTLEANKLSLGREIVGTHLLLQHPALGHALSGGIDGVADFFGDPIVVGAKFTKGMELARYMVQGVEDVDRLSNLSSVQRYYGVVADGLKAHAAGDPEALGRLAQQFPRLTEFAPQLVREGITTPTELHEWFRGEAGMSALLEGRVTGATKAAPLMPKLSRGDQLKLAAKVDLKRAIDWAADTPSRIEERVAAMGGLGTPAESPLSLAQRVESGVLTPLGQTAKKFVTLIPKHTTFDPNSDESLTVIQRLADYVLPSARSHEVVGAWASAPDLGAKRQIYKGLVSEMFRAAHLDATPETKAWADRFIGGLDDALTKRMYSVDGIDQVLLDGKQMSAGLLENHMTNEWVLPSFRELWAQSKRASVTRSLFGALNNDVVNGFMDNVWKPTSLLRMGFATRAGGEELVSAILREGMPAILRGRLAASAAQGLQRGAEDRVLPWHPLARIADGLLGHLPDPIVHAIETPGDFVGAVIGDRTRRAFRNVEGRLAGQEYFNAAKELASGDGPLLDAFAHEITAVHGGAAGYIQDQSSAVKLSKDGASSRSIWYMPNGDYKLYSPSTDSLGVSIWRNRLDELAHSEWGRTALEHLNEPEQTAIARIADVIEANPRQWEKSLRSKQLRDGRLVGADVTRRQAAEDHATAVLDHARTMVSDPDGNVIEDLPLKLFADRKAPSVAELSDIPRERLPREMSGPDVVPVHKSWAGQAIDRGFENVVGRPMDWMIRQPLFIHNYVLAKREVEPGLRALLGASEFADAHVRDVAIQRAINKTIPFIHDPTLKSQFSVATRNLAPFWFAQEQFYKRWAKVFAHSPESFREAQLTMSGMRHAGIVHTDDNGNDFFFYPAAGAAQNVITHGLEMLPGQRGKWRLPLPLSFSGQVRFASPGLERLGLPSFGPLVSVSMRGLAQMFPELTPVEQSVLGERGAGRAYWEQVVPTTLSRFIHLAVDRPDSSPQMASAMMQAIQYLTATGNGPPENATPLEVQAFQDRVRNWTRSMQALRMVYGFSVPASPEAQMDPDQLHGEFTSLLNQMPIEQAVAEFMRRHPDATPYTIFQSKSAGGAQLPATEAALHDLSENIDFYKAWPSAGGWILPQKSGDEKFDIAAYREQLRTGLREKKTPDQFLKDIYFAEAADPYFAKRDQVLAAEKRLTAMGDTDTLATLRQRWAAWKADFMATHPVFDEQLNSAPGERQRMQTLAEMRNALSDQRLPDNAQVPLLRAMLAGFDKYQAFVARFAGQSTADAIEAKRRGNARFVAWAHNLYAVHPEVKGFYDRILRPEVER